MSRPVTETEWLTRSTLPLRLARYIQTRVSARKLQILCCAACRQIESHLRREELKKDLESALFVLTVDQKSVILLHFEDGLTFEEIGGILGKPMNTVKSLHRRGLLALREYLAKIGHNAPK